MTIRFTVPAIPVAQPRQRVTVIAGHASTYTPTRHPVNAFKAAVQLAAATAYAGPPLNEPLALQLRFVFPRPANKRWKAKAMTRESYKGKSDWDNLGKAVCDALNGRVWTDDAWLTHVTVIKCIADGSEQPHVEVCVNCLGA